MLLSVLIAGCSAIDTLDGQIDDPANCCAATTPDRIRACLARFTEPGRCLVAECASSKLFVCRRLDGELSYEWPTDGGVP